MSDLRELIKNLPSEIKTWISSEKVVYTIGEIRTRLNISREKRRVIPDLIARLITKDIETRDFVTQLSINLDVSESAAKIITKELEEKIFHPIEDILRETTGVDISYLHAKSGDGVATIMTNEKGNQELSVNKSDTHRPIQSTTEDMERYIDAPKQIIESENKPITPFILHEEREDVRPISQPPRPTFSIRIPLKEKKYAPITPSVTARIETGAEEQGGAETSKQENIKTQKQDSATNTAPKFNIKLPEKLQNNSLTNSGNIINKLPRPPLGSLSSKPLSDIPTQNTSPETEITGQPQIKKVVNYFWK